MKTIHFPYLALALAVILYVVVLRGSSLDNNGATSLPLLTLLVVSEFAFFVTAIATYIGFNQLRRVGFQAFYALTTLLCCLFAVRFLTLGYTLWPL